MTRLAVLPRSFLYVPGHRGDLIAKARRSEADALILDLEDAVPAAEKDAARRIVTDALSVRGATGPQLWVRVSAETLDADLEAVTVPGIHGVFIAKCDDSRVAAAAARMGPDVPIIGLIEGAAELRDIDQIAAAGHVSALAVGIVDLLADLRISAAAVSAVDSIFLRVVVASAAAGLLPPVAPTQTGFRDLNAFHTSSHDLVSRGFRSRTAIHPSQVTVINDVFAPAAGEVAAAQELLDGFDAAGGGVFVDSQGRMVDAAVIRGAREVVERARALRPIKEAPHICPKLPRVTR